MSQINTDLLTATVWYPKGRTWVGSSWSYVGILRRLVCLRQFFYGLGRPFTKDGIGVTFGRGDPEGKYPTLPVHQDTTLSERVYLVWILQSIDMNDPPFLPRNVTHGFIVHRNGFELLPSPATFTYPWSLWMFHVCSITPCLNKICGFPTSSEKVFFLFQPSAIPPLLPCVFLTELSIAHPIRRGVRRVWGKGSLLNVGSEGVGPSKQGV